MVEMRCKRGGTRDKEEVERMKWGESECVGRIGCPKYLVAAHLLMAHLLHGAPLVLTTTNGALGQDAPLVCFFANLLMAHHQKVCH